MHITQCKIFVASLSGFWILTVPVKPYCGKLIELPVWLQQCVSCCKGSSYL